MLSRASSTPATAARAVLGMKKGEPESPRVEADAAGRPLGRSPPPPPQESPPSLPAKAQRPGGCRFKTATPGTARSTAALDAHRGRRARQLRRFQQARPDPGPGEPAHWRLRVARTPTKTSAKTSGRSLRPRGRDKTFLSARGGDDGEGGVGVGRRSAPRGIRWESAGGGEGGLPRGATSVALPAWAAAGRRQGRGGPGPPCGEWADGEVFGHVRGGRPIPASAPPVGGTAASRS